MDEEREQTMDNWEEMSDMFKIKFLMQQVLGWECFDSWDSYRRVYGKQEYELGAGKSYTTPTHAAFCYPSIYYIPQKSQWYKAEWRVFTPDHEGLEPFDPLHSLDDAWIIVNHITRPPTKPMGINAPIVFFGNWWTHSDVWAMNKEEAASAICLAVFNAWQFQSTPSNNVE